MFNLISLNYKFKILSEEDEEIDIQSIEEIDLFLVSNRGELDNIKLYLDNNFQEITDKYNELIKAVKKLDNLHRPVNAEVVGKESENR